MIHAPALVLSALLLSPCPAPAAPAAAPAAIQAAELDALVRERVEAAARQSIDELWAAVDALARYDATLEESGLDLVLERWLERADELDPAAQLLLVGARLAGEEPDRARLAERLTSLLDGARVEVASAAADLLADPLFRELDAEARGALLEALAAVAGDAARPAELRLAAAVALHVQGRGAEQREARRQMLSYLESGDAELRGLGALALARTGDVETGRTELERLARTPGPEGRLAQAYLKTEDARRFYDRKQKNLEEYYRKRLEEQPAGGDLGELGLLEQVLRLIETQALEGQQVEREKLVEFAVDGMLRSLDEHSSYLPPEAFARFDQDLLQAEYGGIGAYVNEDRDDRLFTITRPIYSGPAYRAGLQSDDKIVRIDDWPTVLPGGGSHPVDEIIKRLKGKPGTQLELYIWRHGMEPELIDRPTEDMAVLVTREQITVPPVQAELLPGEVGLVELSSFTRVASQELERTVRQYLEGGMRALVLDLRRNSGGLLTEARAVADLFLPKDKLVVTTESRGGEPERLYTRRGPLVPEGMPVVVLVDRFSASASEIVAGALQDHGRGQVVGQRTFGKGSVQTLFPVPGMRDDQFRDENKNGRHDDWEPLTHDWNGNGEFDFAPRVQLTIARYLLPSGRSIHRELDDEGKLVQEGGVEPDQEVGPRRFEYWELKEFSRVQATRTLRQWVDERFAQSRELFLGLAAADRGDWSLYPGFEELYASLETTLSRDDVRFLLRREVRRRVQDDRGAAYPSGDFEEDPQLQKAIEVALSGLGESWTQVPEYVTVFRLGEEEDAPVIAARTSDSRRSDLRHALTLISEARRSELSLSKESLEELERLLSESLVVDGDEKR
jgi:carboxyl-terminal processing protease